MKSATLETTVGEMVATQPQLARVFERLGIDYCCGGKKSLAQACSIKGLDAKTVLTMLLADADAKNSAASSEDPAAMSLTQLADHIERTHHAFLKSELPRLQPLIDRIAARHSDKNPKLTQLPYIFASFRSELEAHMAKEEQVLFPLIRQIESSSGDGACPCGTIANPIRIMEIEHQHAGDALSIMRKLTDDYHTPPAACNTYRAVMHSLGELETDMHQHVHKENNVLFPKAIKASSLAEAASV